MEVDEYLKKQVIIAARNCMSPLYGHKALLANFMRRVNWARGPD